MIGIVPQDTVLFNDTMMYNIKYGDIACSDEDVKVRVRIHSSYSDVIGHTYKPTNLHTNI